MRLIPQRSRRMDWIMGFTAVWLLFWMALSAAYDLGLIAP
jgi:hypothetical protein